MSRSNPLICILPRKLGLGGPSSFQSNLIYGLKQRSVDVCFDPGQTGVSAILVIGGTRHIDDLKEAKLRGTPIIHRLNGMNWVHRRKWTGIRHFLKAEWGNLVLARIRGLADRVVYQSAFARDWWQREKGSVSCPQFVIHNAVDLGVFTPGNSTFSAEEFRLLMVEGHHGGGYDQGLVSGVALYRLLKTKCNKPVSLTVVGDVPASLKQRFQDDSQIKWLGVVDRSQIPDIDRSAHLLYSSDVNAACPNAVIEALACGLPVAAFDTGSLSELVQGDAGRVVPYGGNVWNLDKPDVLALADAVHAILHDQQRFSKAARKLAEEKFDLDEMAEKYLKVLLNE